MARFHLNLAVSIDGYLADEQGGVSWLDDFMPEEYSFPEFLRPIQTIVQGRLTYEQVRSFGEWPYPGKRNVVVTSREVTGLHPERTEFHRGSVSSLAESLSRSGEEVWIVGGAKLIAGFLDVGALPLDVHLAVIPLLLGRGLPLWLGHDLRTRAQLLSAKPFRNGVVLLHYRIGA
jgi:dihydrofolate reductase